jgi:hypothetical protein
MARVPVLIPRGVVAGVLEPAKSVSKGLKRIPIRGQKVKSAKVTREKGKKIATVLFTEPLGGVGASVAMLGQSSLQIDRRADIMTPC